VDADPRLADQVADVFVGLSAAFIRLERLADGLGSAV